MPNIRLTDGIEEGRLKHQIGGRRKSKKKERNVEVADVALPVAQQGGQHIAGGEQTWNVGETAKVRGQRPKLKRTIFIFSQHISARTTNRHADWRREEVEAFVRPSKGEHLDLKRSEETRKVEMASWQNLETEPFFAGL